MELVEGDITDMEIEAFVYDITADAKLSSGYGGAIAVRGGKTIQEELDSIGGCPTGEAIITSAGNLKAKHIIHVNGPKFHEPGTEEKLRRATSAALRLAEEKGMMSGVVTSVQLSHATPAGFVAHNFQNHTSVPRSGWDNEIAVLSNLRGQPRLDPL